MTVSSTEGKTFLGIVVAGDDMTPDPYAMGRVKVLCPSIHHPDISVSKLPWCTMASQSDNIGAFSYNRPPPLGSIVEVFYSPGTKSTGQGIIRSVINGVHNPHAIMAEKPGKDLSNQGYYAQARYATPMMHSGPAKSSQGDNVSGQIMYGSYPIMANRDGMDSALAGKAHIRQWYKFKSVSRAKQFVACVWDYSGEKTETPPLSYGVKDYTMGALPIDQVIHYATSRMCDTYLQMGARNYADYIMNTTKTSENQLGYAYSGPKTYDIAYRLQTLNLFTTTVVDQRTLHEALYTLQSYNHLQKCISACTTAIPGCIDPLEPQWEMQIKMDEQMCQPPEPKSDEVETQVLDKAIQRTIMPDGELKIQTEEEEADKIEKKLKKIPYAGGEGWFVGSKIGRVMLRIQKSSQGSAPILKSRNEYPQRLINNTYKRQMTYGMLIDKGNCLGDDGTT